MPKWEIGKTYKTVDGLDAKLIHKLDEKQDRPLIFVITGRNGRQFIAERDEQGRLLKDEHYSLNIVPPEPDKTSTFTNVYNGIVCGNYSTHDDAIAFSVFPAKSRVGVVGVLEIQFEDGEYSGTVFHPNEEGK